MRGDDGRVLDCVIRGRTLAVACGDRVEVAATAPGQGVIEAIAPRRSLFYRADAFRSKLIAANVTQVVGMVAVAPAWSVELLDRWIVAAEANGCRVVVVLNKIDLPGAEAALAALAVYRDLGYPVIATSVRRDPEPVRRALEGEHSVLVGQSGMGKSTLINALLPDAGARIGELSEALGSGRHTTTATALYALDERSWLIDSPGMQVFGLAQLSRDAVEAGFREMRTLSGRCRFRDCSHTHEPDCAVRAALARGEIDARRVETFCRMLAESAAQARR